MSLTRREIMMKGAATAALCAGKPLAAIAETQRQIKWQNWSGGQECVPAARLAPANAGELAELLASSPKPIRPVGTD